ncbi:hypothetical protein LQ318_11675 [Aliifodinibius salicampi]|uniref:C2H2-type domain-containing protein n=1 Tax=Fodinibius salicampi TaxID=1920655 RepID=A0ABT3Q0D8_9BACT|nr:hypothetical protein [Fodinibius salicampi]MCW9713560.1 hypothetical protein [Fodinibius salicampi]
MDEEREPRNTEKEKKLTCPECGKAFKDMRGLTSHARHIHEIEKEKLIQLIEQEEDNVNMGWKIVGGIGAFLATIITLGNSR